ncbi:unnamed protein product, partial [Staurois parvus]
MNRDLPQRSRTAIEVPPDTAGPGSRCCTLPGSTHRQGSGEDFYKQPPAPALLPSSRLYTWAGQEVV